MNPADIRTLEGRIRNHYEHTPDEPFHCRTAPRTGENPDTFLGPKAVREKIAEVMGIGVGDVNIVEGSGVTERDPELHPTFEMTKYTARHSSADLQPEEIQDIVLRCLDSFNADGAPPLPRIPFVDEVRLIPPGTEFEVALLNGSNRQKITARFPKELPLESFVTTFWLKYVMNKF